jgi:hypothetical protein
VPPARTIAAKRSAKAAASADLAKRMWQTIEPSPCLAQVNKDGWQRRSSSHKRISVIRRESAVARTVIVISGMLSSPAPCPPPSGLAGIAAIGFADIAVSPAIISDDLEINSPLRQQFRTNFYDILASTEFIHHWLAVMLSDRWQSPASKAANE